MQDTQVMVTEFSLGLKTRCKTCDREISELSKVRGLEYYMSPSIPVNLLLFILAGRVYVTQNWVCSAFGWAMCISQED